jgi:broad specificity phosphatase PhoE
MTDPRTSQDDHYRVTLLRHGESVGNAEGHLQGQSDFPLTELGREQSRSLAAYWVSNDMKFNYVISSPLSRARETAEIIAEKLVASTNLDLPPVEFIADWQERDSGQISGLRMEEAERRYPRPDFIPLYQPIGATGESQWELYLRAGRAVQDLIDRPPGRYLVVSHGGILNMVMYAVLGIVPQPNFHGARFRFQNTAYATLVYTPSVHTWLIDSLNDHRHLRSQQ